MCQGGLSRVLNDRLFTASPRERMGSNHPNFFTQANTRLVEGLELKLFSLLQSHILSHEAMVCSAQNKRSGDLAGFLMEEELVLK